MTERRDPVDDELLRRALLGEIDEESEEFRRRSDEDPSFHADLRALREMEERLRVSARDEANTLASARALDEAPGEENVHDHLAGLWQTARGRTSARGRPRLSVIVTLAAAALLLLWAGLRLTSDPEPSYRDIPLGPGFTRMTPSGAANTVEEFTWVYQDPLPPNGYYEVSITDEADGLDADPIFVSRRLTEPAWDLPDEVKAALPERFVWEVIVRTSGRRAVASQRARVILDRRE